MKILSVVLVILWIAALPAGCDTQENIIERHNGKNPVCVASELYFLDADWRSCRTSDAKIWVCWRTRACVPIEQFRRVWELPAPEAK